MVINPKSTQQKPKKQQDGKREREKVIVQMMIHAEELLFESVMHSL